MSTEFAGSFKNIPSFPAGGSMKEIHRTCDSNYYRGWIAKNPELALELYYAMGTKARGVSIQIFEKSLVVITLYEDGTETVEEFGEKVE